MIRYLVLAFMGIISIILIDPNPLWGIPLLLVLLGSILNKRWLLLGGILLFSTVSVGKIGRGSFNDLPELIMLTTSVVLPIVVFLEVSLSSRPYRLRRISLIPALVAIGIVCVFFGVLFLLGNIQRIGVYISSDPLLQVFILMSLATLLTSPILLGSRPPERENRPRGSESQPLTIKTNK